MAKKRQNPTAIATSQPAQPAPMDMAQLVQSLVTNPDVDMGKFERFLDLYKSQEAERSRIAFIESFAALQGDLPTIARTGFSEAHGAFARMEDLIEGIRGPLATHGFGLSFEHKFDKDDVTTIGTLSHIQGHTQASMFVGPVDTSGRKNDTQARASACSYGRRYCANALLNLVSRGEDDDAQQASGPAPQSANALPVPEGFESWWHDIQVVADEGFRPFQSAWKSSSQGFKDYVAAHHPKQLQAVKVKSTKAGNGGSSDE